MCNQEPSFPGVRNLHLQSQKARFRCPIRDSRRIIRYSYDLAALSLITQISIEVRVSESQGYHPPPPLHQDHLIMRSHATNTLHASPDPRLPMILGSRFRPLPSHPNHHPSKPNLISTNTLNHAQSTITRTEEKYDLAEISRPKYSIAIRRRKWEKPSPNRPSGVPSPTSTRRRRSAEHTQYSPSIFALPRLASRLRRHRS